MQQQLLIVFDGECGFCSRTVRFLQARDPLEHFRFLSMQSDTGSNVLRTFGIDPAATDTLLLIKNGHPCVRSDAAIEIARELGGAWRLFVVGYVLPRFIRDGLYRFIARHRHNLLRTSDKGHVHCDLPPGREPPES